MGCGCKKSKVVPSLPSTSGDSTMTATSMEPKTYDVIDTEGAVVASTTNLVFARVEARRTGSTVVLRETAPASPA